MAAAAHPEATAPHTPVLLRTLLAAIAPVDGTWLDGTFGAGGSTRGLLEAGAARVVAVDSDPGGFSAPKSNSAFLTGSPAGYSSPHNSIATFLELVAIPERSLKSIVGHICATTTEPGCFSETQG